MYTASTLAKKYKISIVSIQERKRKLNISGKLTEENFLILENDLINNPPRKFQPSDTLIIDLKDEIEKYKKEKEGFECLVEQLKFKYAQLPEPEDIKLKLEKIENLEKENHYLKNRSFWKRLFNK